MKRITAREAIRHALHLLHLDGALNRRRVATGQDIGHLSLVDRTDVFAYIYRRGVWRNGMEAGSLSGFGSELAVTETLRRDLAATIAQLGARSVLDIGCGDFNWMQHVDLGQARYLGVDIVPSVIEENQRRYGSHRREFRTLDAVVEPVPDADIVLCREVLIHLSFADGKRLLANLRRSAANYFLLTSDASTGFNADITTGDYRVLNLRKRPYRLPAPDAWLTDDSYVAERAIGVWPCGAWRDLNPDR